MKVYVVHHGEFDSYEFVGVWASLEGAQRAIDWDGTRVQSGSSRSGGTYDDVVIDEVEVRP